MTSSRPRWSECGSSSAGSTASFCGGPAVRWLLFEPSAGTPVVMASCEAHLRSFRNSVIQDGLRDLSPEEALAAEVMEGADPMIWIGL